ARLEEQLLELAAGSRRGAAVPFEETAQSEAPPAARAVVEAQPPALDRAFGVDEKRPRRRDAVGLAFEDRVTEAMAAREAVIARKAGRRRQRPQSLRV